MAKELLKLSFWAKFFASVQKKLHTRRLDRRKAYRPADYEELLRPYLDGHEMLLYREYVREKCLDGRRLLLIRHDIDHDYLTALRMARWESTRGIRATYCVLHSAWYYGPLKKGSYTHTKDMLVTMQEIQRLGHEISFHNDLVGLALETGLDPVRLLKEELAFFRENGIEITGSATHGTHLCRELKFRNWELFTECCDDRFGGPRTVEYDGEAGKVSVELGKHPLSEFGLEYEAYDIARDVYHTDSGGALRTRHGTRGRRLFGRKNPETSQVVGVLTHPIWWDFSST